MGVGQERQLLRWHVLPMAQEKRGHRNGNRKVLAPQVSPPAGGSPAAAAATATATKYGHVMEAQPGQGRAETGQTGHTVRWAYRIQNQHLLTTTGTKYLLPAWHPRAIRRNLVLHGS